LGDAVAKRRDDRQKDLLWPALEEIIDLGHPLVRLRARSIGGFSIGTLRGYARRVRVSPACRPRLVAGLFILKQMHNLSDEVLCVRWLENPYYQFFCGELSFCHQRRLTARH
jgi:IS5 family transposase